MAPHVPWVRKLTWALMVLLATNGPFDLLGAAMAIVTGFVRSAGRDMGPRE
jgi:hypothetical protein